MRSRGPSYANAMLGSTAMVATIGEACYESSGFMSPVRLGAYFLGGIVMGCLVTRWCNSPRRSGSGLEKIDDVSLS